LNLERNPTGHPKIHQTSSISQVHRRRAYLENYGGLDMRRAYLKNHQGLDRRRPPNLITMGDLTGEGPILKTIGNLI
jgi:hypothetical protein